LEIFESLHANARKAMNNESNYYKINTLNENPAQPGLERRAREYEADG
jgi:hypothetical protein